MQSRITHSAIQQKLVELPLSSRIFLEGPASSGKTTAGVRRLLYLLEQGVPGSSILLLVPQRTLARPYLDALNTPSTAAGGLVTVLTISGLAQRMVDLFWPLAAEQAGFARPDRPPVFLTLETAQYYMAHLVRPLLAEGYFDSVTIDRNRLYSQILDNLNKAAVVGFPYTEIGQRLTSAWAGSAGQSRVYQDAQECATKFRQYCLAHNLLDFSLQVEVFLQHLWPDPHCRGYLLDNFRHLFVDNLEEEVPITCDLLREWLPHFDSALLIYDQEGGYRYFLGADPQTAYELKNLCQEHVHFQGSFVVSSSVGALGYHLLKAINPAIDPPFSIEDEKGEISPRPSLGFEAHRYYPQMLDWVAAQIASLVQEQGVPPEEIGVLAPFLSDSLRFSLANRLERYGILTRSHRPSRPLREEPAAQCLLTLAYLGHPQWTTEFQPTKFDFAYALMQAIQGMDLVRARFLAEIVYRVRGGSPELSTFDRINTEMQKRITFTLGERYERLRSWLETYQQGPVEELDHFLGRLFGEVLSQPGFSFHADLTAGEVAANLIESVQKFRRVAGESLAEEGKPAGQEYLEMVQDGVIAAQYVRSWRAEGEGAVLLAPAYTFLLSNRPVEVQFWLDIGSRGWFERLYQPLTHPYVLNRHWLQDKVWSDVEESQASQGALYRLVQGLLLRCRRKIFLGLSELGEQGYEQLGPLLRAFQRMLQHMPEEETVD